jgi:hypothetical protein
MRVTFLVGPGLAAAIVSGNCGENERDENKPKTFFDTCAPGGDACAPPFECLSVPQLTGTGYCTQACEETPDCPSWEATGHCAGHFQSQCSDGICNYGCE